jgi:hypothetical protein
MGATCCTGRSNLSKPYESASPKIDSRFEMDYSETSSQNDSQYFDNILDTHQKQLKSSPPIQESFHDHGTSFGLYDSGDKKDFLALYDDENESKRVDTVAEPEMESDFEYDIDTASQLPASLRKNIVNLFSKHGIHEECMDGFLDIIEYLPDGSNEYKTLVISSDAIYIVDPDEFVIVHRRISIEKVLLMCITAMRDFLCLKVKGEEDYIVYSGRMEDLVKAILSVYNSKTNVYLPAVTLPNIDSFYKNYNNPTIIQSLFYSDTSLEAQRVICKHGIIGETILHFARSQKVLSSSAELRFILLTDRAYYSLYTTYRLEKRLELNKILQVTWDKTKQTIVIQFTSFSELWKLPASYIDNIKEAIYKNRELFQDMQPNPLKIDISN